VFKDIAQFTEVKNNGQFSSDLMFADECCLGLELSITGWFSSR
jgi:hypothetical protein